MEVKPQNPSPGDLWKKTKGFLFENRTTRQTIAKNTFWLGGGIIASRLIKAVLIIYAARVLGTEGYGIFSYALGLSALFSIFSDLGISSVLTREASKNPASMESYFATGFFTKFALLAVSVLFIIFIAPTFTGIAESVALLPLAAFLVMFDGLRDLTYSLTRAREKMQTEAAIHILTNLAITTIGLVALHINATPLILLLGYTVGSAIGMVVAFWISRRHLFNVFRFCDKSLVKTILTEAWPLALMGLLATIMTNTDTVLLGWLRDASEVGTYSAALRPVQLLYFIPVILSISAFPPLARSAQRSENEFRNIFEGSLIAVTLISVPVVIGSIILRNQIVEFIFGPAYLAAVSSFAVLSLTLIPNSVAPFFSNGLFAYNTRTFFLFPLVFGVALNAGLDILLIPKYGAFGCAVVTILVQTAAYVPLWYKMKRSIHFTVLPRLKKVIISGIIMAFPVMVLMVLGIHILLIIPAGAIVYFGTLLVLKEPVLTVFTSKFRHGR